MAFRRASGYGERPFDPDESMPSIHAIALLFPLAVAPIFAQTVADTSGKQPTSTAPANVGPTDTHTLWSPQLPTPFVDPNASPAAFMKAAEAAIAAGRLGEAQEAIERAESRVLDRAVRPSKAGQPSQQKLVRQLSDARQALGAGDKAGALRLLEAALANPESAKDD
jgi:hypothetical protein